MKPFNETIHLMHWNDFSTFLDTPIQSSFYFDPFVPAEVEDEIKVLPNN